MMQLISAMLTGRSLKIVKIWFPAEIFSLSLCLCLPVQTSNSFIFVPFMHHFSPYVRLLNLSPTPINLPLQIPPQAPVSPSSLLLAPVFICQLTANPCPTPPRLYLFSRARALPDNHHLPTHTPGHPASHAYIAVIFRYLLIFDLKQSPSIFALFIQSFFCRRPRVDGWCRHILNSIPATTIRI